MKKTKAIAVRHQLLTARKYWTGLIWLIAAILALLVGANSVWGQNYESLPIHPDFILPDEGDFDSRTEYRKALRDAKGQITQARTNVLEALKSGRTNFSEQGDRYMLEFKLAEMTQTENEVLSRLGELRTDFLKEFLGRTPDTARPGVIAKILPPLEKIVNGDKYHPAVRVNAITLIGLLDQTAGDSNNPPRLSSDVYDVLKRAWKAPTSPEAVRVAAISGIRRMAEISRRGAGDSLAKDLQSDMAAIVNGTANGQDQWAADFSYWMKRRATQILGFIGEGNSVVDSVNKVMNSETALGERDIFWLRFDGLQSLSNLKFDRLDKSKVTPLMDDVLQFAAYALERESGMIQENLDDLVYVNILWGDFDLEDEKAKRPRGPGGGGGRPRGGKPGNPGGKRDGGPIGSLGGGAGSGTGLSGDGPLGGGRGGDPRGGGRGGDPRGGGARGGSALDPDMDDKPHRVELPTFMLNDSRARIKAVLVTALDFMHEPRSNPDRGIVTIADDKTKTKIDDEIVPAIKELINATEVGVIDYKALKNAAPPNVDVTFELINVYKKGAEDLRALMTNPPAEEKKGMLDDESKPADGIASDQ